MTTLQALGWWHIPAVLELEAELFPESPWSEAQFWSELAAEDRHLLVSMDHDQVVGYAGIRLGGQASEIMTLAVRPSYQGRGIGTALLRALLDAADHAGAPRALLEVEVGNDRAIALYERFGFVRDGVRKNYYGIGIDALLMERHV